MERITKKQVVGIFEAFCKTTGREIAQSFRDTGKYGLDYNGAYGGWVVFKYVGTGGGQQHPMGDRRRSNREMWETLHFAMRAHEDITF